MLDILPAETWSNPNLKFLDPACKTGVFLREIAKRLIIGLKEQIPDLQQRLDHIFHNQLYGIAITELTALASRRSLYCSKYANGKYSVSKFDNPDGNIRFVPTNHTWENGKCKYCGASASQYQRADDLETHAYEFIHTNNPEEIFGMKFDVIIGNPPYQLKVNESGKGLGAIPIYQKFVENAQKMNPDYLSMIIQARWYSGGVGLDDFRKNMLANRHIKKIVDYPNSNDCFPGLEGINGGVCYFVIDKHHYGNCEFENIRGNNRIVTERKLDEFEILIRDPEAISIIHKVQHANEKTLAAPGGCSPQTPYGFLSTYVGRKDKILENDCCLLSSKGKTWVSDSEIKKMRNTIDMYKPMISKLSYEHAGNPDKNGMYRLLSRMEILKPKEICSQSYLVVCPTKDKEKAKNTYNYLRTRFVRFLILQTLAGMNISIDNFIFVPWLDFSEEWNDDKLYKKYNLSTEEIDFIESMIKPMEDK